MSKSLLEIYRSNLFSLVKTIVIKCDQSAIATNKWLEELGYVVDWDDRKTWKYYLNLSGNYHQFDHDYLSSTDGYIPVKVAGNNGPITTAFTKELIVGSSADTGTAAEYAHGSRSYKDLVSKYKLLEPLIMGILYSVDLDLAVNADDWSILHMGGYYAESYKGNNKLLVYKTRDNDLIVPSIEPQEVNLIPLTQQYITRTMTRWITPEYCHVDNLYLPICIANLAAALPGKIANIRLGNCKTNMAHTFYIEQYLDGYGRLGKHVKNLDLKETLWLYRNVDWLNNNYGKVNTFNSIVDNILTKSNVPLAGYILKHNTASMDKSNLYPTPKMVTDIINFKQVGTGADEYSIRQILDKEIPIARHNSYDIDNVEIRITKESNRSKFKTLPTKVLESRMIDYSDYNPYPLSDMLINNWVYHAANGSYRGTLYVTNPYTNERLQLSPLNAFILMTYCYYKGSLDITLSKLPELYVRMIPKTMGGWVPSNKHLPYPTIKDLEYGVETKRLPKNFLASMHTPHDFNFNIRSSDIFYKEVKQVHDLTVSRHYKVIAIEDMLGRAMGQKVLRDFYWDDVVVKTTNTNETYDAWLARMSIDLTNLSSAELVDMADKLLIAGTGIESSTENSLRALQKSCIDILKHFSSYTVQFLESTLISSPGMADAKLIRIGDVRISGKTRFKFEIPKVTLLGIKNNTSYKLKLPIHKQDFEVRNFLNVRKVVNLKFNLSSVNMYDNFTGVRVGLTHRIRLPISKLGMVVRVIEPNA